MAEHLDNELGYLNLTSREQLAVCWALSKPSILVPLFKEQHTHHSVGIGRQESPCFTYWVTLKQE